MSDSRRRRLALCAAAALAMLPAVAAADDRPPGGILAGFSGGILAHGVTVISRAGYEERGVAVNGEIDFVPFYEILGDSMATARPP